MAKPASETLFVRLPAGTRARLQALADADLADMSTIARRLILRGLEAEEPPTKRKVVRR